MSHVVPVEQRIGRVLEPLHSEAKILDVIKVVLEGLSNDVGPAPVQSARCVVDVSDQLVW
jgi:hypothetical protein